MPIDIENRELIAQYAVTTAALQGIELAPEKLESVITYLQLAGRLAAGLDAVDLPLDLDLSGLYKL